MAGSQAAVAQLAAMGYMNGGMDPTLQLLTSGNPVQFLNQASTVMVVDNEAGERLTTLQREQIAAQRAQEAAKQEVATVDALTQQINGKVSQINAKMAVLDSAEMTQAMVVFNQTGQLPQLPVADRRLRWRRRAAGGADAPRRPVRLGRRRTGRVRLLRPRRLGLRAGGDLAPALHRGPVEPGRARLRERPPARRPGLLLRERTTWASTSATA